MPKIPTTPFRDQVVKLQALPLKEADPAIALLCNVRALRIYVDRTQSFRTSDQLFACFGGQQKGKAVSKQRLAHWIVEAIVFAYQARHLLCPLGVKAHSTRGIASSLALARGASIANICRAAGWATPNTFARFYNLRIEPVSSRVLSPGWPTCSVAIMLAAPFPSMDQIRVLLLFLSSVAAVNPVEVPPAPSAFRCGGGPDARSSIRMFAQGQPLCWSRCPCVVIPLQVNPHVFSSAVRLPSR